MIERSDVVWDILTRLLVTTASAEIDDGMPNECYGIREADIARFIACLRHMRSSQTMTDGHMLASMMREPARTNDAGD